MGHLVTVQNLLRSLGAPLSLARDEFPVNTGFYPFAFRLEPLSKNSAAKYAFAEMPPIAAAEGIAGVTPAEIADNELSDRQTDIERMHFRAPDQLTQTE